MSTDLAHLTRADLIRRIYFAGGRMTVGTPGDGNPLTPYRSRFVAHVLAGWWGR